MRRLLPLLLSCIALIWPGSSQAADLDITLYAISSDGVGEAIGTVLARDSDQGLEILPALQGLAPGEHGFHLHENGSCDAGTNANPRDGEGHRQRKGHRPDKRSDGHDPTQS